jgi:hypothetical protein
VTATELLGWLRFHGHAPEARGEQVFVPRWPYVPEEKRALVREHRVALRALLVAVSESKQEEQESTTTAGAPTTPSPTEPPAVVLSRPDPPQPKAPASAYQLPRELWDGCGIYVLNGVPTCSRGDQHAAKIIAGEIRYEEAVRGRRATETMLADMAHSCRRRANHLEI